MESHIFSILANPNSSSWDFAFSVYQILSQKTDKFELNKVFINKFRDGEIKPKIEKNVRNKSVFYIHDSNQDPKEWFTVLALVNQTLKYSSAKEINDVLPYLRFSRQDRKDETRVPISAKVVADTISLYADRAISLDIHNPAIQGFYTIPFDNLYSFPFVVQSVKNKINFDPENTVVMGPDAGGAQKAAAFAKRLGVDNVAVGYKTREKPGEVKSLKILGDVNGKDVIIVDDIIDSGGTLINSAKALKENGANKIYVYCTHALFTKGTEELEKVFDLIIIGDTIKMKESEKIKIVPLAPLFAEAIYRISEGESLSELFD